MGLALASADRGEKGDIVARRERCFPGCELLVARGYEGRAEASKGRKAFLVVVEQIGQGCAVRNIDGFFRESREFPHTPEEEHFYAQIGRDAEHREIVT